MKNLEFETKFFIINLRMEDKNNIERFNASVEDGLSDVKVLERKDQKLTNKRIKAYGKSLSQILLSNIFSVLNITLLIVMGVMLFFQLYFGLSFAVLLLINIGIGLYGDIKARVTLKNDYIQSNGQLLAIRNGERVAINQENIVLDDVIFVEQGDRIGFDGIILKGEIGLDESFVNGHQANIFKKKGQDIISGSLVTSGSAYIRVEKIAKDSFVGTIQSEANRFKRPTSELSKSLKSLFMVICIIAIAVAAFILVILIYQNNLSSNTKESVSILTNTIAAIVPIGLYLLTSIACATGVRRLGKKNIRMQDFYSIETLAKTDVFCVDKTGTLTDGTYLVKKVVSLSSRYLDDSIAQAVSNVLRATGDKSPVSISLLNHFDLQLTAGVNVSLPFNSENKYLGASFKGGKTLILGAPEYLPIKNKTGIIKRCEEYLKEGCRVIVLGESKEQIKDSKFKGDLETVAFIVLKERVRADAADTFKWLKQNDVDVKIISSDDARIVSSLAAEAGVANADRYVSLENVSLIEVKKIASKYSVFGNANAEQKEAIILALKAEKKKVTMVGDGINDILALKRANCSIVMNNGANEAKNVSHVILKESKFADLLPIIREGRRVSNNIQRIASLFIIKTITVIAMSLFLTFASLFENDFAIQHPFVLNNLLIWDAAISGVAALFLAIESNNEIAEDNFVKGVLGNTIPASILLTFSLAFIFVAYLLQKHKVINLGIESLDTAVAMSVISITIIGTVVFYKICSPLNKYRTIVLISLASFNAAALVATSLITYLSNKKEPVLQIPYLSMNGPAYMTIIIMVVVLGSLHIFIQRLIEINKGDNSKK